MNQIIPQFGLKKENLINRPSVYAVIIEDEKILVVEVNKILHLPGGGKEKNIDDKEQLINEIREETGYEAEILEFIGKANQYTRHRILGYVNKIGEFYTAKIISNQIQHIDTDHIPKWITIEEYLRRPGLESHKWIVKNFIK